MSDSLQALQERLAHLSRTVDEMSDVVARQDAEISRLQHRVQMLMEREGARQAEQTGGFVVGDERPPHY